MEIISPYIFPICRHERLDTDKYPYAKKYARITSDDVIQAIIEEYQVDMDFVTSKGRSRRFVDSRMILSYVLYTYTGWTLTEIGTLMGGRDHTTVIHNREMFRGLYYSNEEYKERADRVLRKIGINPPKTK